MSTEAVQQQISELDSLNRQIRRWKLGATVACGVIILTGLLVLRNAALDLVSKGPKQDQFFSELTGGLQRDTLPEVTSLTMSTLDKLMPPVKRELARLQVRSPELTQAASHELELLGQEMPQRIQQTLQETMGKVIAERDAKIRHLFPEVTEEKVELMVKNLSSEGQKRLTSIGESVMHPYTESIQAIMADFIAIREVEGDAVKNRPVTWEVAVLCANLLQDDLRAVAPEEYARFVKETSLTREAQ